MFHSRERCCLASDGAFGWVARPVRSPVAERLFGRSRARTGGSREGAAGSQPSGEANGPAQRQEEGDEAGGRQREDEPEPDVQRGRASRSREGDEEDERREREREAGGQAPGGVAADAKRGDERGPAAVRVVDAVDWWGRVAAVRSLAGHTCGWATIGKVASIGDRPSPARAVGAGPDGRETPNR